MSLDRSAEDVTADPPRNAWWTGVVAVTAMATQPFLALALGNVGSSMVLGVVATWWALTMVVSVGALGVCRVLAPRSVNWAGGVVAVCLWCLFNLPLATAVRPVVAGSMTPAAWWGVCTVVVMAAILPAARHWAVQRFIVTMALLLVASTLVINVVDATRRASALEASPQTTRPQAGSQSFVTRPNVWFVALDGLASNSFVEALGFYDPGDHERRLESLGFVFQDEATSNYPLTHLSLSSTLMGDFGYQGSTEPSAGPFLRRLRGANRFVAQAMSNDYSYAHAHPGIWIGNRCSGIEDLCVGDEGVTSEASLALARITPLAPLYTGRASPTEVAESNDPAMVVQDIVDAGLAPPQFSFVHVLNPHPPLLRTSSCEVREVALDMAAWGHGREYSEATECLHQQLERSVEIILSHDDDPLIVFQADHGPRLGIDWAEPGGVVLDEDMHFSIYSAIRMPSACQGIPVPDDLTSVNTLRIARSCLEGRPVELLPNRHFAIQAGH